MLAIERIQYIRDTLQKEKKVIVADLAPLFDVTEETVRRDLMKLENEGVAQRIYGGAVLAESTNVDLPYSVRKLSNVEEKQAIAGVMEKLIPDNANIMMDGSSTALFVVKSLKVKKNLTVITNSAEIVCEISDKPSWRVFATGGILKEGGYAFVGARTVEAIKSFHVDYAIFSCKGIDKTTGLITDINDADAEVKRAILGSAKRKILAADSTKFDRVSLVEICGVAGVDMIVTDSNPGPEWIDYLNERGIGLYFPSDS
ncbi:MAG: DeoR/GlpR transcriptional regulator [Clostridia bacterium]|nr:DeoR/GlpR transcriptional regulator [Clostridia bacterium]